MKNELKNYRIFLLGQFISQFGSKMTSYCLGLWAYKQSGSVLSLALLSICYLVPEILLNFIAGSLSDNWNKKILLLIADGVAAFFSITTLILLLTGNMKLEYLYVINVFLGITDAFQAPASEVAVSLMISKDNYMRTSGMQSFSNSFITIFYPVVATSLYALFGMPLIILIDLGTFAFAFITLLWMVHIPNHHALGKSEEKLWHKCSYGMKFIWHEKGILMLIIFMAFVNLIAAAYNTNLSPMVLARTNGNEIQLGIVSGTIGVASLLGGLLATRLKSQKKKVPVILNIMSFSFLICNSMLGIGRNYYFWSLAVFLGNLLIPILTANVSYIMRTKVPLGMQGRVFSARNTLQYLAIPIGNYVGGFLSDKVFEPFMLGNSKSRQLFESLVGSGKGSGIALLYVALGIIGFMGCCVFRGNKQLRALDME